MFIFSIIKKLDLLGPTVQFTIRKESNFKTFFGGTVTILSFILYILLFISFGQDFYKKENPSVFSQVNYFSSDVKSAFEINNENVLISYGFKKNDLAYLGLRPEDLVSKAYFHKVPNATRKFNQEITELQFISCADLYNKTKLFENNYQYFNDRVKDFSCLVFPKNETFFLRGSLINFPWNFIKIKLFLKPNNNTCSKALELDELSEQEAIQLFPFKFLNTKFNPKNYDYPFFHTFSSFSYSLNFKRKSSHESKLEYHLLNEDDGQFFSNESKISRFSFIELDYSPIKQSSFDYKSFDKNCKKRNETYLIEEKNLIAEINLNLELSVNYEYFRSYKKIQDVLGNVNGVMDLLNMIFLVIISLYSSYRLDYFLMNSNINVRENEEDPNNKVKNGDSNNKNSKLPRFDKDIEQLKNKRHNSIIGLGITKNIEMQMKNKNNNLSNSESDDKSSRISFIKVNEKSNNLNNQISSNSLSGIIKKSNALEDLQKRKEIASENKNNSNKEEIDLIAYGLSKYMEPKKVFLQPNIFYYFFCSHKICGSDKKRKMHLKIFSLFAEKISNKLDILYYFKLIKKVKNLQSCLFSESEQAIFFDILSKDLYPLNYKGISDDKFFEHEKCDKGKILIDYYKNADNNNFYSDEIMNEIFPARLAELL